MALPRIVQGATYNSLEITWYVGDDETNPLSLSGATLTGYIREEDGDGKAITGTLTPDADQVTNKGVFIWEFSAADVAIATQSAVQYIQFYADFSGEKAKTFKTRLVIEEDISL